MSAAAINLGGAAVRVAAPAAAPASPAPARPPPLPPAVFLHAALLVLDAAGEWPRLCPSSPLSPALFARPNARALQAALHLLHTRWAGAAGGGGAGGGGAPAGRRRREAAPPPYAWPLVDAHAAAAFRSAMRDWVRGLAEEKRLPEEASARFVVAYQTAGGARCVEMLAQLAALALEADAGRRSAAAAAGGGALGAALAAVHRLVQVWPAAGGAPPAWGRAPPERLRALVEVAESGALALPAGGGGLRGALLPEGDGGGGGADAAAAAAAAPADVLAALGARLRAADGLGAQRAALAALLVEVWRLVGAGEQQEPGGLAPAGLRLLPPSPPRAGADLDAAAVAGSRARCGAGVAAAIAAAGVDVGAARREARAAVRRREAEAAAAAAAAAARRRAEESLAALPSPSLADILGSRGAPGSPLAMLGSSPLSGAELDFGGALPSPSPLRWRAGDGAPPPARGDDDDAGPAFRIRAVAARGGSPAAAWQEPPAESTPAAGAGKRRAAAADDFFATPGPVALPPPAAALPPPSSSKRRGIFGGLFGRSAKKAERAAAAAAAAAGGPLGLDTPHSKHLLKRLSMALLTPGGGARRASVLPPPPAAAAGGAHRLSMVGADTLELAERMQRLRR